MRAVIINDASVARGGATGLALMQVHGLRARGIETVFVAGDRGGNEALIADGVKVHNVGGDALLRARPLTAATRGIFNAPARDLLRGIIESEDTPQTVYHVHSFAKSLSPSIFSALRLVASRVFVHAHDFFLACPNGAFVDYQKMEPCTRIPLSFGCLTTQCDKRNYAQKLWRTARQGMLHRTMLRDAPWGGIMMIHPGMRPYLEKAGYPADMLQALRNPAEPFRPQRVRAELNKRFFFIGRLEAEKGILELIHAAARARVALTVIGEGPLRAELTVRHPEVRFVGWMDRAQISKAIGEARAVVMPTRYPEPFGLVAAEASLSGLPVILSQTALLGPEIVGQGLGLTCDLRDPESLVAGLRSISEMPQDDVAEMSLRGAAGLARLSTTPEDWIDRQVTLYRKVLGDA